MKKSLFVVLVTFLYFSTNSLVSAHTSDIWQDYEAGAKQQIALLAAKNSLKQRLLLLDAARLQNQLKYNSSSAISANKTIKASNDSPTEIELPLPDGSFVLLTARESPILSPELAERYPQIKTWRVSGKDNPAITGRIDFTSKGFHGMLSMPDGDTIYIDPDNEASGQIYQSISKRDNPGHFKTHFNCQLGAEHRHTKIDFRNKVKVEKAAKSLASLPALALKTYRLALAGTAEYTASQGGSKTSAYASMVTTINRVNQIYNRDIGINLQIVSGEELIYTNAATDPYSNNDAVALVNQNIQNLAANFGINNFDIGHVFAQGPVGGLAYIGVACINTANTPNGVLNGIKAGGATGTTNPQGEIFSIEYVAHEMGHQLGATHTFNSTQGSCGGGNRTAETAVEPGSGSTIMSYSGLCGSDDLQYNSEAAFHFASISQINSYTRSEEGSSCGTDTNTGNQNPTANAGADHNIPANTPFLLNGSASGGSTYSWDQIDTGSASAVDVDTGNNAIIRSLLPTANEDRYIPALDDLFAGTHTIGEKLPQTTRELNFAYVVRDGEGGIGTDTKKIAVTNTYSLFTVTSQSTSVNYFTGETINVAWNTAETEVPPVNCQNVDIQLLRVNGEKNILLAATPNDGNQDLVIPATTPQMAGARMMLACSDN